MYMESFHNVLKSLYMKGKENKIVDKLISILLKISRDKAFERMIKLEKGKSSRITTIRKCHTTSLKLDQSVIQHTGENEWSVQSCEHPNVYYKVVQNDSVQCTQDTCTLRCNICNICIHQYCCECPDSILQTTICKHIHLVVRVVKTGQSSAQRTHHSTQEDNDNILSEVKNQSIPPTQSIKEKAILQLNQLSTLIESCDSLDILKTVTNHLLTSINLIQVQLPNTTHTVNRPVNKTQQRQRKYYSGKKKPPKTSTRIPKPTYLQKQNIRDTLSETSHYLFKIQVKFIIIPQRLFTWQYGGDFK